MFKKIKKREKKNHPASNKTFSEANIIKMSEFLGDVFFNTQSAFLQIQIVLLLSPTCSFIRMKQTSCRRFSEEAKRS